MAHSVVLVGCGNMGFAMLSGWLKSGLDLDIHVIEPAGALRARAEAAGAQMATDVAGLPAGLAPDLVILAVKPQMVAPVLAKCAKLADSGATFVSVAAGITIASMQAAFPAGSPIIRCMPNTPASIGEGMMALFAGPGVSTEVKELVEALFSSSGSVAWVEEETLMDAVTAISGSGPAYVFHFVEALTEAGQALGLPADTAALLARQTVAGAGRMALVSDTPPGTLREQVTSPGGTTAAALNVFMTDGRLTRLVAEATKAARDRSVELGRQG